MTRLAPLSSAVIRHGGRKRVCSNRDKTDPLLSHACVHTFTYTHTKPCGTGLVDLLIGCVFWQANLKNRPLSAHKRFSCIHCKTMQNASLMTDVTYLFMSATSGPLCVSSISTCMRAGQPADTDIFDDRTNASNRLSNCHHSSPFNQFVFPPVNGFQPSTHSKCFYWFKTKPFQIVKLSQRGWKLCSGIHSYQHPSEYTRTALV